SASPVATHTRRLLLTSLRFTLHPPPPHSTLFPYTTLFRSPPQSARNPKRTYADRSMPLKTARKRTGPTGTASNVSDSVTPDVRRSEEHTSELQSRFDLVCRLLLEKKNQKNR